MRRRWPIVLAVLLTLGGISLVAARTAGVSKIEERLSALGYTWTHRKDAPLAAHWTGLTGPLGSAEQLSVMGTWPITVRIRQPIIDIKGWIDTGASERTGGTGSALPIEVMVEDMKVLWEDRVLLEDLSGPLRPKPNLSGPNGTLQLEKTPDGGHAIVGTAALPLDLPEIKGQAKVSVRVTDTIEGDVLVEDAVLHHSLIGADPLPALPLRVQGSWNRSDHAIQLFGSLGNMAFSTTGTAQFSPLSLDVELRVPDTPLGDVVAVFGKTIPEAKTAKMSGHLAMRAEVAGPPWKVLLEPTVSGLNASGVLPENFGRQTIQWKVRDADGHPTFRQTGPSHRNWTHLNQMSWMPQTVVAAEDGGFPTHPGYDLGAIREALYQAQSGERLRGGSTLTQQLAKNLFLSGERTLTRKLRELLYALDLERSLPKSAILALYLNVVEFGPGIYGIAEASDAYFLKRPQGLTLAESAWLASILPSPRTAHARARKGRVSRSRVTTILQRMVARKELSTIKMQQADKAPLRFVLK